MINKENIHGLNQVDSKTTMMQNSQWGAIAYLAQSEYGNMQKLTDGKSGIWNNPYNEGLAKISNNSMSNYSTNMTGMSGSSRDNNSDYYSQLVEESKDGGKDSDSIKITYTSMNSDGTAMEKTYTNTYYRYYTENGQKASTTRNIYGIYDMSGGAWEYMANYLGSATGNTYVSDFLKIESKYQTSYAGTGATSSTADRTINYEANKGKYGDAIWETSNGCNGQSSWNHDCSYFPYTGGSFFLRGGYYYNNVEAGLFSFDGNNGNGDYSGDSFRVVLF